MTVSRRTLLVMVLVAGTAGPGRVYGWGHGRPSTFTSAYCEAAPVPSASPLFITGPTAPTLPASPPVVSSPAGFAVPRQAPPSSGPVAPTIPTTPRPGTPRAGVSETRTFEAAGPGGGGVPRPSNPTNTPDTAGGPNTSRKPRTFPVGFWNLGRDEKTLIIEGRAYRVPARYYLTVEVSREFVWEVPGEPVQREAIPNGKAGMEIVLRR